MIYPFARGIGHLPERAFRVAEELGASIYNYKDADGTARHWLSFDVEEGRSATWILVRAERIEQAMSPWRTDSGGVDATLVSCKEHGRALICPSCRAAEIGRKGGAVVSKEKLKQLHAASKRPRPSRRKENQPAKGAQP